MKEKLIDHPGLLEQAVAIARSVAANKNDIAAKEILSWLQEYLPDFNRPESYRLMWIAMKIERQRLRDAGEYYVNRKQVKDWANEIPL